MHYILEATLQLNESSFHYKRNKFKPQEIVIKLKFDDKKGHHVPAIGYVYSLWYPLTTQTL